jgi:hypothetical protein
MPMKTITTTLIVLGVLAMLVTPAAAAGEENADRVVFFQNQFIPVESIVEDGSTVIVTYRMDLMLGPDEFGQDIPYIFGKIAYDFPFSRTIKVVGTVGDEEVRSYTVQTDEIFRYTQDLTDDDELLDAIDVTEGGGLPVPGFGAVACCTGLIAVVWWCGRRRR